MAATAVLNHLGNAISIKEDQGSIVEAVTSAHITGITGASATARFQDCYTALDSAGATVGSSTTEYTALRLTNRDIQFESNQNTTAIAILTYQTVGLGFETVGTFYPEISSSLQQVPTQFDVFGNQIAVSHTYASDDKNFPSETLDVTATVNQYFPQAVITYKGIEQSDVPILLQQEYIGRTNSAFWNGGEANTWLCADITATARDLSRIGGKPYEWDWNFSFQYDPAGWAPQAIYIDPQTNKPPTNLVDGVGIKNVITQPSVDFNVLFPG